MTGVCTSVTDFIIPDQNCTYQNKNHGICIGVSFKYNSKQVRQNVCLCSCQAKKASIRDPYRQNSPLVASQLAREQEKGYHTVFLSGTLYAFYYCKFSNTFVISLCHSNFWMPSTEILGPPLRASQVPVHWLWAFIMAQSSMYILLLDRS